MLPLENFNLRSCCTASSFLSNEQNLNKTKKNPPLPRLHCQLSTFETELKEVMKSPRGYQKKSNVDKNKCKNPKAPGSFASKASEPIWRRLN